MNISNTFYKNDNDEMQYNETCSKCKYKCKQSFRTEIMTCKHLKELKKKGKKK